MSEPTRADEKSIFGEVQRVIDGLMKFDEDSRMLIYRTVGTFFRFDRFDGPHPGAAPGVDPGIDSAGNERDPHFSSREEISPKDFLFRKQPNTNVDRIACLAYYLSFHRGTPHFRTTDLSKLNTEAAQIKLSNASATIADAMQAGLLATAAKGAKQLTVAGEKYVEALPDHAAAKAVRSAAKSRRSRRKLGAPRSGEAGGRKRENG